MGIMTYKQLIQMFGGAAKTARALGYTRQAVYLWREKGIPRRVKLHVAALKAKNNG